MLRHALHRALHPRKDALPTVAVVLTLALGIGANTALFTVVNAVLLRPFPYPEGPRLVVVHQTLESLRTSSNPRLQALWNRLPVSYLATLDWRARSRSLAAIGLYRERTFTLQGKGEPEAVDAAEVDAELFAVLGVPPVLGRTFSAAEVDGRERVVVLGHGLWQRTWGGDPGVLGSTLRLDGEPHAIVGVMPAGFEVAGGPSDRLWTPLRLVDEDLRERDNQRLSALARLAAGATFDEAAREMDQVARAQAEAWPETHQGTGVRLVPLLDAIVGDGRSLLAVLMAAVAVVLAVACVNVVHLLLVRTAARRGELAVRLALGARRSQLARQLLLESLVPALAGGGLGLLLAVLGRGLLVAWLPADLPRTAELPIDGRVLAFALGASLFAALVCGLPPALSHTAAAAADGLRGGARNVRGGGSPRRDVHGGFVVAEIALTLMLTVAAGLLVRSFTRLAAVEPGFRTEGVLVQDVRLPEWSYPDETRRQAFTAELLARLARLPAVRSAALTTRLPVGGRMLVAGYGVPGAEETEEDWTQGPVAALELVTPGYFETLGIPLRRGRSFTAADRPESGRVVVMNEVMAGQCWPGEDPVGREIVVADRTYSVVGVVANVRHEGLAREPGALMLFPWSQRGDLTALAGELTAVLAVAGEPMDTAGALREAIRAIDPALPLAPASTLAERVGASLGTRRSRASLVLALAALAFVLALVGTYAVISFTVSRRGAEIAVRMALGASAAQVSALVLRRTLRLALLGIALGILGALGGGRLLEKFLWGVEASDPPTLAAAAVVLALAAAAAGFLPARRASRLDPARALRDE